MGQPLNANTPISIAPPQVQPRISVAPPMQQQSISVAPPVRQPNLAVSPQPGVAPAPRQLNASMLDDNHKRELVDLIRRIDERQLTPEQKKTVVEKYIEQNQMQQTTQETPEVADRSKGFFGRLGDDFKQRYQNLQESSRLVDEGKQGNRSFAFQVAGQLAGGVGDILGEGLTSAYRTVAPRSVEDWVANKGDQIFGSQPVQDLAGKYAEFKANHPVGAKNLEAGLNIGSLIPVGKVAKLGAAPVAEIAERGAVQLEKNIAQRGLKEALELTAPKLTIRETEEALAKGLGEKSLFGLGKTTIKTSLKDTQIAQAVEGLISKAKSAVDNIAAVRQGIATIGEQLQTGLKELAIPFNNNQIKSFLNKAKEGSRVLFGSEKTIERQYDAVVDLFMKELKKEKNTLDGALQARKNFDTIIENKFPGLLSNPAGDVVRRNAVLDVRRAANDFIASKLPKDHPFKELLRKQSLMYDAIDRIAALEASNVNKGIFRKALKVIQDHPIATSASAFGLGAGGILGMISSPMILTALLTYGSYRVGKRIITTEMAQQALLKFLQITAKTLKPSERSIIQEMIETLKKVPIGLTVEDVSGTLSPLKGRGGIPGQLSQPFETQGFSVGLTNVAGRGATQSDVIMQEAKALYDAGKFAEAQLKYNEAVNFGVNKVKDAFVDTGIKVKAKPGFGVFEGSVEPNIDLEVTVPKGKEDLFHAKLAQIADENFNQKSTISYRSAPTNSPLGLVDEGRQIYNEPIIRLTLSKPATVAEVRELNELMAQSGIFGGSFKDNGRTIDIINLSHYNKDYETFNKSISDFAETLNRKGLLSDAQVGVAETRHIGSDAGNAPISYKQVQSEFRKQNPDFKPRGTKAQRSLTSKVLDRLPLKERVSKAQVEQLLKSQDIPAAERELVSSILAKQKDTIKTKDLEYLIRKNLLNTKPEDFDKWADYGMSNLEMRYENPRTIVLRTPVKHGVGGHFGVEDDFGHIRVFEKENYSPSKGRHVSDKKVYVAEIQADAFQRGLRMRPLKELLDEQLGSKAEIEARIAKLEENLQGNRLAPQGDRPARAFTPEETQRLQAEIDGYKKQLQDNVVPIQLLERRLQQGQEFVDQDVENFIRAVNKVRDTERALETNTGIAQRESTDPERIADYLSAYQRDLENARQNLAQATAQINRKPSSDPMVRQFKSFEKDNKYRKRMLEETLVNLRDEGYEEINLPTPSTVARVEWGKGSGDNIMPYEIISGDADDLRHGDVIDYGGERMVVVESEGSSIRVAPEDKVSSFDFDDWVDEEVDYKWGEVESELETLKKDYGDPENPVVAQRILAAHEDKNNGFGLDYWDTESYLRKIADDMSPENAKDEVRQSISEGLDFSYLEDIYGRDNVFSNETGRYSSKIYVVEDGSHTEVFDTPDNYDTPYDFDPETIDRSKAEAQKTFSSTEMGVLDNYYELQKNLKEIQKRTDIQVEYVREEDNYGNPITWIRVIPNKNLKKTAF